MLACKEQETGKDWYLGGRSVGYIHIGVDMVFYVVPISELGENLLDAFAYEEW